MKKLSGTLRIVEGMSRLALSALLTGGLFFATQAVSAEEPLPNCMEDVVEQLDGSNAVPLNCTANDVNLGTFVKVTGPDTCVAGDPMQVQVRAQMEATSAERWDIGLFIALDGGDALRGSCHQDYLPPPLNDTTTTTPPRTAPFYNAELSEDPGDSCGDLEQGILTLRDIPPLLTVVCQDVDQDGTADLGACTSWDNAKSAGSDNKPSCTSQLDTRPSTKAKCNCESTGIAGITVESRIYVDKVTNPPDDATSFDFSLTGPSTSQAFSLADAAAPHDSGGLTVGTYSISETSPAGWVLTGSSCIGDNSTPNDLSDDNTYNPGFSPTNTLQHTLLFF